ncbi:MAG: ATP-dependent helicase HrpA, partial [Janthinobacterium sp.]
MPETSNKIISSELSSDSASEQQAGLSAAPDPGAAEGTASARTSQSRAQKQEQRLARAPGSGGAQSRPNSRAPRQAQEAPFRNALPAITFPEDLPVSSRRADIAAALLAH